MRLSDLQTKEIINMTTGKRLGLIIDVIINAEGNIKSLILDEKIIKPWRIWIRLETNSQNRRWHNTSKR